MKPTIGRIVIYRHFSGAEWPAMITRVHNEGLANLHVFPGDGSPATGLTRVKRSENQPKPNTWSFPVVEKQAEAIGARRQQPQQPEPAQLAKPAALSPEPPKA